MAVNLSKGQRVSLDKNMTMALVGLGWKANQFDSGFEYDLDASAFLLGKNGKVLRDEDFIFYGNQEHRSGSVKSMGDEQEGNDEDEEGDAEQIFIDFTKVPPEIEKIAITVTIYDASAKKQNFGQVSNAYVRVARISGPNDTVGTEVLRFDLGEEFSIETAIVVCEIYRNGSEWKFNAVGAGYQGGLEALCRSFGVNV